jgi:hypothetical protein
MVKKRKVMKSKRWGTELFGSCDKVCVCLNPRASWKCGRPGVKDATGHIRCSEHFVDEGKVG